MHLSLNRASNAQHQWHWNYWISHEIHHSDIIPMHGLHFLSPLPPEFGRKECVVCFMLFMCTSFSSFSFNRILLSFHHYHWTKHGFYRCQTETVGAVSLPLTRTTPPSAVRSSRLMTPMRLDTLILLLVVDTLACGVCLRTKPSRCLFLEVPKSSHFLIIFLPMA